MLDVSEKRTQKLGQLPLKMWRIAALLCLWVFLAATAGAEEIPQITPEMFLQPAPYQAAVVIDAGDLGQYRVAPDTETYQIPADVTIRKELVQLLNAFQSELGQPVLLLAGYHSAQHQIYRWAKWVEAHPTARQALNTRGYKTWRTWTEMSQRLESACSLVSKHQIGDAVSFHWEGLTLKTDAARARFTERLRKLGGNRYYTDEERAQFKIPAGNNALFKVISYQRGENINVNNPLGTAYFHIEYQPSPMPPTPNAADIGKRIDDTTSTHQHLYRNGDILYINVEDYYYIAKVMTDTHISDSEVEVWLFVDDIRKKVGTEVLITHIYSKRERPPQGWGKKIAVEYFDGEKWHHSWNVKMFEDHYQLPEPSKRKLAFDQVRLPKPKPK